MLHNNVPSSLVDEKNEAQLKDEEQICLNSVVEVSREHCLDLWLWHASLPLRTSSTIAGNTPCHAHNLGGEAATVQKSGQLVVAAVPELGVDAKKHSTLCFGTHLW